jgi:ABC-type antimicrobial peptide transport system permease subunit
MLPKLNIELIYTAPVTVLRPGIAADVISVAPPG